MLNIRQLSVPWTGLSLVFLNDSDYRAQRRSGMLRLCSENHAVSIQASTLRLDGSALRESLVKFAIVGYGQAGRAYGSMIRALSGASVNCVVDADLNRAEAGARGLGAPNWYDDVTNALRHADLDAVIVASPHGSHSRLAREALDRGLHVLLEAPVALRYPDAERVLAYARASKSVVAVNFGARATPGVRRIRSRIPRPTFVQIEAVIDPMHVSWMGKAEHGGLLGLLGSHAFDLACFLMRSKPLFVQALGGRHTRRADLADTVAAGFRFGSGGLARVVVGEYGRSPALSPWRVLATDGIATATASGELPGNGSRRRGLADADTPFPHPARAGQEESLRSFVEAVAGSGQPLAELEDGVRAVQLADAVYEAMSSRRRIPLAEMALPVSVGPVYADDSIANRAHDRFGARANL